MRKPQRPLLEVTLELLEKHCKAGLTRLQIFKDTGLNPEWVSRVRMRKVDPTVSRVQQLHDYLIEL